MQPDIGLSILKTEPDTGSEQPSAAPTESADAFPWFLSVQGEITGTHPS